MSFHHSINESNIVIKVRHAFNEDGIYEFSFTVPTSGIYKIEAWGARGSSDGTIGPPGAYSKSYVSLNKDESIQILVGEKGYVGQNSRTNCGGGGGGTFIAKGNLPLCVAGGGGFANSNSYNSVIQSHACGQSTQLSANYGSSRVSLQMGGNGGGHGGGGGGFIGNGNDGSNLGKGGISFLNGGTKQTQGTYGSYAYGGFGGGASRHGCCGYAPGGGGYTGGSASNQSDLQGGGGGSYFEGNYGNEALSLAISGCNSSIPPNPGTNGNGFAILTFFGHISYDFKDNKMSYCNYHCYQVQLLWTLYATLISQ
jgi:hypothetical protein